MNRDLTLAIYTSLFRGKYKAYIIILTLLSTACTDEMLIDAYDIGLLAPDVPSCSDIYPLAISENVVLSYSSGNLLYTDNNFETVVTTGLTGPCGDPFSRFDHILYMDFETILASSSSNCNSCDNPMVLKSTDHGITFTELFDRTSFPLHLHVRSKPFFPNSRLGFIALFDSNFPGELFFYKSHDETIEEVSSFEALNKAPRLISFKNSRLGIMITQDYDHQTLQAMNNRHSSYSTNDGGITWEEDGYLGDGPIKEVIYNDNQIFAISKHMVFHKSIDSKNWNTLFETEDSIEDIDAFGKHLWLAVTRGNDLFGKIGNIYFSTDSGSSWDMSVNSIYVEYIDFVSENYGVATSNQVIQTTNDGGKSWELKSMPLSPFPHP